MLTSHEYYKVLLFGGSATDAEVLANFQNRFSEKVINLAGRFPLEEELAIISNLDVMLAMDSSNGHLAANYGVTVITLWGVTHPHAGFAPFGQLPGHSLCADRNKYPLIPTSVYGNKYPPGYEKAIRTIAPELIVKTVLKAIGN